MILEPNIKGADITGFKIVPDVNENPNHLHELSLNLLVENPIIAFSRNTKNGKYDILNDEEYNRLYRHMKAVNYLFRDDSSPEGPAMRDMNIFLLAERLGEAFFENIFTFEHRHRIM